MPAPGDRLTNVAPSTEELEVLQLLKLAVSGAFDPVIIHHPDGTLLWANESASSSAGMTAKEFAELPPWGWSREPAEMRERHVAELRATGKSEFLSHDTGPDGDGSIVEVSARWVETDEGPIIVSVTRDVTEKLRAEEMLREMAFHDPLTGLANRALLDDRLKLAIANAERHGDLLGVVFLDMDDFKPVNDTYGHDVGDRVLKVIAERLANQVRHEDTVARMGGDEFLVLLPRVSEPDALQGIAEKLVALVSRPIELDGHTLEVTPTCGYALYDRARDDAHSLVMRADIAMYQGRRAGMSVASAEVFHCAD